MAKAKSTATKDVTKNDEVVKATGKEYKVKFVVVDGTSELITATVTAENKKDAIKAGEEKLKAEHKDATAITFTGEIS